MAIARTKAIIAVFGGDDPAAINLARELGAAIAKRGQIVLTGGTAAGEGAVRDSAIAGAGSSPWIGVSRTDRVGCSEPGGGFVIDTALGHKRNYLEAHLCDAAIGLLGGDGTLSEVTFALSLRRPVALVGDHWRRAMDLDSPNRQAVLDTMIGAVIRRAGMERTGKARLDALLNEGTIRTGLRQLGRYQYFPRGGSSEVITWILALLSPPPALAGMFPHIEGYEDVATEYQRWLARQ